MGIVYCIRNTVNSKAYIGITIRPVAARWKEHIYEAAHEPRLAIHRAIRKYGVDAFSFEVLEVCDAVDELLNREVFWIRTLKTQLPHGYNTSAGGLGCHSGPLSEEHKRKIAAANTGRRNSPEMRAKMRAVALGRSPEHLAKISAALTGKCVSDVAREKIRAARAVQVFTPEVIERRTQKLRGRTHTDTARAHMSAAQKGRIITPEARVKIASTLQSLTRAQAALIRFNPLGLQGKTYAALFGVSPQTVSGIRRGRTYTDVTRGDLPEDAHEYIARTPSRATPD
jgi:group I intron endonuclease